MADDGANQNLAGDDEVALPRDNAQIKLLLQRRMAGGGPRAAGGEESRSDVLTNLNAKIRKLEKAVAALNARLDVEPDPEQFNEISAVLADTRAELDACEIRYQLIDNGQPFQDPGEAAEDALLAAIGVVNRALANTAAVSALLRAVSDLVAAYKAQATS